MILVFFCAVCVVCISLLDFVILVPLGRGLRLLTTRTMGS
jgi:hypothetical protein